MSDDAQPAPDPDLRQLLADNAVGHMADALLGLSAYVRDAALARMKAEAPVIYEKVTARLKEAHMQGLGEPRFSTLAINAQGKLGTPELLFLDPFFRLGLNVTVRDGRKWDEIAERLPQPVVIKRTGDGRACGTGKIIGKMVCKASDIPDFALSHEHSATCRTPEGLYAGMKAAYGESWTPDREVTVLFFTLDD